MDIETIMAPLRDLIEPYMPAIRDASKNKMFQLMFFLVVTRLIKWVTMKIIGAGGPSIDNAPQGKVQTFSVFFWCFKDSLGRGWKISLTNMTKVCDIWFSERNHKRWTSKYIVGRIVLWVNSIPWHGGTETMTTPFNKSMQHDDVLHTLVFGNIPESYLFLCS